MIIPGIFGEIVNPFQVLAPTTDLATSGSGEGIIIIVTNLVRLSMILAGVYTLINLILAGYGFLSAGGDTKLIQKSTERIWRSVLGLIIVASSIMLAAIIGYVVFKDPLIIINPKIYTP